MCCISFEIASSTRGVYNLRYVSQLRSYSSQLGRESKTFLDLRHCKSMGANTALQNSAALLCFLALFQHLPLSGTLQVFINAVGSSDRLLWQQFGDKGNSWLSASVTVISKGPFTVTIVGVRGQSYQGDIAIDDIVFKPSGCSCESYSPAGDRSAW